MRRWIRCTSARICTRSLASRLDSGSSIRNTEGERTIARPIATRCRCPPDSWLGLRSSHSVRPRISPVSFTLALISAFGILRSLSANPMFSATVMWGYSA